MDRSRIIIVFALGLSLLSIVTGLLNIGLSETKSDYAVSPESFLTAPGKAGIALVRLNGVIVEGASSGGRIGADEVVREFIEIKKNSQILAVIIEINSPGGAVVATKKIYDQIMDLRKVKPVIAVVSDIAASGGYYIASASDRIFAYEGSIVGSIGVIMIHANLSGLLDKYGVKIGVIKAGRYKDSSYPFRAMTEAEIAMDQAVIDDAYTQFLNDVSEGRKQPLKTVQTWADGKIFSGKMARVEQIVDEIGGRDQALQTIKLMLKRTDELPIYEKKEDFFKRLMDIAPFSSEGRESLLRISSPIYYLHPNGLPFVLNLLEGLGG